MSPSNADLFIQGFVEGIATEITSKITCGLSGTFESGAEKIYYGIYNLLTSKTAHKQSWEEVTKGMKALVDGIIACKERSWWSKVEGCADIVITAVCPEGKIVAGVFDLILNGKSIINEVKVSTDRANAPFVPVNITL
jgi:hypothetical protein